ncbi:MAG: outer membrane lipid asymmetry maintenance protein MlaD [Proteobacteria bacterium]|nr:outer membrane lipid asymmetry maintenance protein MlaD [Pseudomonadota bacterium]
MSGQSGRNQWGETVLGAGVLALALGFMGWTMGVTGGGGSHGQYKVTARFGDAGALQAGAKITISGVKIGQVAKIAIDPKTFMAVTELALNSDVAVPSDSTAKITSDGLLGGAHVAISPGGAADNLKAGSEITNTQGAVDLFGLIGQFIRPQGGAAPAASSAAPVPAATPNPATAAVPTY